MTTPSSMPMKSISIDSFISILGGSVIYLKSPTNNPSFVSGGSIIVHELASVSAARHGTSIIGLAYCCQMASVTV